MRRTCLALLAIILISWMMPTNALALVDWLEHMSGPGRFKGYGVQVKLFCFGKEDSEATRNLSVRLSLASTLVQQIKELTEAAPTLVAYQNIVDLANSYSTGGAVRNSPRPTLVANALILGAQSNPQKATAETLGKTLKDIAEIKTIDREKCNKETAGDFCASLVTDLGSGALARGQSLALRAQTTAEVLSKTPAEPLISSFGGNDFSACPVDQAVTRTTSLNLAVQNMIAPGEPGGFAGGHDIRLVTVIPTIVWNPLRAMNKKLDFVDFGAGAGVYTFSSPGGAGTFEQFSGLILEPVRVNGHVSKAIAERHWWLAIPNYTFGLVVFPKGIEGGAFGDLGGKPSPRIPAEWLMNSSIFFDVSPFIHWMQERTRNRAAF